MWGLGALDLVSFSSLLRFCLKMSGAEEQSSKTDLFLLLVTRGWMLTLFPLTVPLSPVLPQSL